MKSEPVLCSIQNGIATLTLNGPDTGNAIDLSFASAFSEAVEHIAGNPSVRVLLINGKGRAFCVGGDIAAMSRSENLPDFLNALLTTLHSAARRIAALPVPVVCAIHGPVGGGGIGIALCGDIVLASESVKIRGGYSAIGLSPDFGASWWLTKRAGPARAKRILLLNEAIDAAKCLEYGLLDAVYPDQELAAEAASLTNRLASGATQSFQKIKQLVDGVAGRSLEEHLDLEARYMIASSSTIDASEGLRAFLRKATPVFQGR
ncbi:enoyl-CoA hydratase-related protein [Noviherbaspirillum sp. Root189]|uniref:enoyl-CoA hydratase-related protein n=1 Tax=Noviherbaspirillum sp. Root189 TaxID=1736487 RepID=UPI0007091BF5|nr:enoyl-CoA hydratase-related protein [Noviherbaspirillum sp. Root189]KRB86981.1 hypothetical protein ASE07_20450 [Noviherbaspirillum sp. Root189]